MHSYPGPGWFPINILMEDSPFSSRSSRGPSLHQLLAVPEGLHQQLPVRGHLEAVDRRRWRHRVRRQAEDVAEQRQLDRHRILEQQQDGDSWSVFVIEKKRWLENKDFTVAVIEMR